MSFTGEGGHHQRADRRGRTSPPPVPRRENRVALLALAAACDSDALAAGAGDGRRDAPAAGAADAGFGARVLVRAPVAGSAGTAAQPTALVRAMVVSAADEDGYVEVVYEGASLPVRVPRDQIIADAPPHAVTATSYASGGAGPEASFPGPDRTPRQD